MAYVLVEALPSPLPHPVTDEGLLICEAGRWADRVAARFPGAAPIDVGRAALGAAGVESPFFQAA